MITSVLTMKTKPGCADAVVQVFERAGIIERALTVEGCHEVTVLTGDDEVMVTATWTDAEAYQAWLDHPQRNASEDELNALLANEMSSDTIGGLFRIALTGSNDKTGST